MQTRDAAFLPVPAFSLIALACGFSSLPPFSRSFRARYGKPLSALRAS